MNVRSHPSLVPTCRCAVLMFAREYTAHKKEGHFGYRSEPEDVELLSLDNELSVQQVRRDCTSWQLCTKAPSQSFVEGELYRS